MIKYTHNKSTLGYNMFTTHSFQMKIKQKKHKHFLKEKGECAMAKNWKFGEAVRAIMDGNKEAILDIGRRYPLFLNLASQVNEAGALLIDCVPEYCTARKIESVLKGDVVEKAETEDTEDGEEETPKKKKEKPAKKPAKKKVEPEDDDDDEDEGEDDWDEGDEGDEGEDEQPKKPAKKPAAKKKEKPAKKAKKAKKAEPEDDDDDDDDDDDWDV